MKYKLLITKEGREYLSNYSLAEVSEYMDTFYTGYLRIRFGYAVAFILPVILQLLTKHPICNVLCTIVDVALIGLFLKGVRLCRNYFLHSK